MSTEEKKVCTVEVLWTNPDKEEEWVVGSLHAVRLPSGGLEVLWLPLDANKEWTWACKLEHLLPRYTRLAGE